MRINISIDDVCPHEVMGLDAVNRMKDLISFFPDLKVSLFVPVCLCRYKYREKSYYILDYPKFIDELISLPINFEVCYHGYKHGNKKTGSNNDEFRYLQKDEAISIMKKCANSFFQAQITAKPVFRPPGFWLSPAAFDGCNKFGIRVFALHAEKRYKKAYAGKDHQYTTVYVGKQPYRDDKEIIYHGGKDQRDFFNKNRFTKLLKWIKEIDNVSFVFLEDFYGKN